MKYRMDAQHYHNDMLLEPGTEVGDDCPITWRDATGHPLPPSKEMTPLDAEAKKLFAEKHGGLVVERDPTKAIPIQGTQDTAKKPPIITPARPAPPAPVSAPPNKN